MDSVFEKYFTLSDAAVDDEAAKQELIALFSPTAVVEVDGQQVHRGQAEVVSFLGGLLDRNRILRHVWVTEEAPGQDGVAARWGVTGVRKTGEVFTRHGTDVAFLDGTGRIRHLDIHFD